MKKDIESLINRLARKGHDKECMVERGYCCEGFYKKKWSDQYPTRIGDVFEKMGSGLMGMNGLCLDLISCWEPLGFTNSLQEIYMDTEWEELETIITPKDPKKMWDGQKRYSKLIPTQKPTRELFQFLLQLDL